MGTVDFATIFSVAFFASFGHCIGMCGGFVVLYASSILSKTDSITKQLLAHFIYNTGRISSYVLLGVICGYIGSVISITNVAQGYLFFIVGVLMVLMGLSLLGVINFLKLIESNILMRPNVKKIFIYLKERNSIISLFPMGILNGLIPCGLVYFFLISSLKSSSIYYGALTMFIFGAFTLPAMVGFGFFVSYLTQNSFKNIMIKIASLVIIMYGIYTAFSGYMMIME